MSFSHRNLLIYLASLNFTIRFQILQNLQTRVKSIWVIEEKEKNTESRKSRDTVFMKVEMQMKIAKREDTTACLGWLVHRTRAIFLNSLANQSQSTASANHSPRLQPIISVKSINLLSTPFSWPMHLKNIYHVLAGLVTLLSKEHVWFRYCLKVSPVVSKNGNKTQYTRGIS